MFSSNNVVVSRNPTFQAWLDQKSVQSESTKRTYAYGIPKVVGAEVDAFLTKPKQTKEKIITDYIITGIKQYGLGKAVLSTNVSGLRVFCEDNDVLDVNWKKLDLISFWLLGTTDRLLIFIFRIK